MLDSHGFSFVFLQRLSKAMQLEYLDLRNNPYVSLMAKNTSVIELAEHYDFLAKLGSDFSVLEKVGSIVQVLLYSKPDSVQQILGSYTLKKFIGIPSVELGLFKSYKIRGSSNFADIGKILLAEAIDNVKLNTALRSLSLYTKHSNKSMLNLIAKFNFSKISQDEDYSYWCLKF